jgi:hypothetical protein
VIPRLTSIDKHFRDLENPVEFQVDPTGGPGCGNLEMLPVPPIAHVEFRSAEVRQRKRMRRTGSLPLGILEIRRFRAGDIAQLKFPIPVEIQRLALECRGNRRGESRYKQAKQQRCSKGIEGTRGRKHAAGARRKGSGFLSARRFQKD